MTDLKSIVAWIETKNNQFATRFEPGVYQRLTTGALTPAHNDIVARIMTANSCSFYTACQIYSTSFGKYQLMGFNIYVPPFSFKSKIYDYQTQADYQDSSFDMFVNQMNINFDVDALAASSATRDKFASTYNGSAANYSPLIVLSLQHFGITVQ